jgi:arsenate reductase-like glutaredoxin family protein
MRDTLTIYHNPACTKSREMLALDPRAATSRRSSST